MKMDWIVRVQRDSFREKAGKSICNSLELLDNELQTEINCNLSIVLSLSIWVQVCFHLRTSFLPNMYTNFPFSFSFLFIQISFTIT